MKRRIFFFFALLFFVFMFAGFFQIPAMLEIGDVMPLRDIKMMNIDDKSYAFEDMMKPNGLLVIFSCNTCPFVIGNGEKSEGWQNRYPGLNNLCKKLNVGMVLVNSNAAKRDKGDSLEDMKKQYKNQGYNNGFYVLDKESEMANSFGARTTPHVYLFNKDYKLVYRGAIDDNVNRSELVEEHYLVDALKNMVAGKPVDPATTKQLGCSIKRK